MSWSTATDRIPHVYEQIFNYLNVREGLTAAEACPNWEYTIFSSQGMRNNLALKIFREPKRGRCISVVALLALLGIKISDGKQMISMDDVNHSCRTYDSVIISPGPDQSIDWEDLTSVLKHLNHKQPIRWAKIDGSKGGADKLTKPTALMKIGRILTELRHLEIILPKTSLWDPDWTLTFESFEQLESLILHNGHVVAMESVRAYCKKLKRVELINFSLPNPNCLAVFVTNTKELIVDGKTIKTCE